MCSAGGPPVGYRFENHCTRRALRVFLTATLNLLSTAFISMHLFSNYVEEKAI